MRRLPRLLFLTLLFAPLAYAQEIPTPPVRYDEDVLSPAFHAERRARVLEQLNGDGVAIFFSAPVRVRENDVDFEYRQDSYLYYLTGSHEPETVLLLSPNGIEVDGERVTELLLVPPRDAFTETWVGRRFGPERAQRELGVQKAVSNDRFEEIVGALVEQGRRFYHLPLSEGPSGGLAAQRRFFAEHVPMLEVTGNGFVRAATRGMLSADAMSYEQMKPAITGRLSADDFEAPVLKEAYEAFAASQSFAEWDQWRTEHLTRYADFTTLPTVLNRMRMIKTDEEMVLMRRAIDISVLGHLEVIRSIEPGMYEYEAEALFEYISARNGAPFPGYPAIVGAGENSIILHYNTNRKRMEAGEVVVMDMGAEYHGYTADITRTVPVSGTFSPEQRAIYELVLRAQNAGIEASRAGNPFTAPGQAATRVITEGLRALGLIQTERDVRNFFMHGTSHYLGLWVHDVGDGGPLQPGTVITVEPGIYIKPSPDVDPKWWNIGVRIEDDILITHDGPENLSAALPREVEEIEALMREGGLGNEPAGRLPRAGSPARGGR